jgi:exodeoxyribonuclease VII large subunit
MKNVHKSLDHLEQIVTLSDPKNILRKGYSITYMRGVPVRDCKQLNAGDLVTTTLATGSFESEIKSIQTP